ncbi:hypothetical protein AN958_02023 [Leucoagaricus sp. SymC.cos]|nr:hypothetical protein AN958_02023 [Leucoagaricus sp. SymC.cos]
MSTGSSSSPTNSSTEQSAYPEQRHAGKVGYGPNYHPEATMTDKIVGLSEEIHGKLAHKPDLIERGHDKKTGKTRRRNLMGLDVCI